MKVTSTNFEIFRLRDRNIPVDVLELTDPIIAFAWEPKGHRFAIVHGEGQANKYSVSFYSIKKTKIKLDGKQHLFRDLGLHTYISHPPF